MDIARDSIFKNSVTRTHDNIYVVLRGGGELQEKKDLTSYTMKNKK
jgi:hypothetical protein